MAASAWDPAQYARFRDERAHPFLDLMALVRPRPGMRVADLGCGTGEMTRRLHEHLGARETVGIDSSASMLAQARSVAGGGLSFRQQDIADFAAAAPGGEPYDLVFSNAALQWLPDHAALLARLTAALTPDGQLAFQVPAVEDHPSWVAAAEVAEELPFREALGGYSLRSFGCPYPEEYALLLHRLNYREQHVRLQVSGHVLSGRDDVAEWMKGTLLVAYQQRLPTELFDPFLARYRERLLPQLEDTRPYFFPFKRVLAWAQR
jgi:trans-aconitate 2-methyltransferase